MATTNRFYYFLSTASRLRLLAAIFCLFAPLVLIALSGVGRAWQWWEIGASLLISGCIASAWAWAGMRNRSYWLPILVNVVAVFVAAWFRIGSGGMSFTGAGLLVILVIVTGYVLFVTFVRSEGARIMHLQTEMTLAKEIHDQIVPELKSSDDHLEIAGTSAASTEVGGDLIDLHRGPSGTRITVADVSGHGVRAGVLMAMLKSSLRTKLLKPLLADNLLEDVNDVIFQVKRPDMFATAAMLHFDHLGQLHFAGAGHPPVLKVNGATGTITRLESQNPPLGVIAGIPFIWTDVPYSSGDLFLVLTDGLTEAENAAGVQFEIERVEQHLGQVAGKSLGEIQTSLLNAVRDFGAQTDDQTLVLVRVK